MKTLRLDDPDSQDDLQTLNKLISSTRKIVVLTGAGISRNAGIPDFRSSSGLYKQKYSNGTISCRELFDVSIYRDESTIRLFNEFMQNMYYQKVKCAHPTKTHQFIKYLNSHKKLMRCYTQNIDGLERRLGMRTEFDQLNDWNHIDVVQLHGDLNTLKCSRCFKKFKWNEIYVNQKGAKEDAGFLIACPSCMEEYKKRQKEGKRCCQSSIGIIRPNIVLYGEEHPYGEILAKNLSKDIIRNPKLFLIFGTSLKVNGVKNLVRKLCRRIHRNVPDGKVAIINNTKICQSVWDTYIDYQIVCDCDDWCDYVESCVPRLSQEPKQQKKLCVKGSKKNSKNEKNNSIKLQKWPEHECKGKRKARQLQNPDALENERTKDSTRDRDCKRIKREIMVL